MPHFAKNHVQINRKNRKPPANEMVTTRLYLDARATDEGEAAPLKIGISKNGSTSYLPLGIRILPSQWDRMRGKIKDHPNRVMLNSHAATIKQQVDMLLMQLSEEGKLAGLTATQVKHLIQDELSPECEKKNLFRLIRHFE